MKEPAAITALLADDLSTLKGLARARSQIFEAGSLGFNAIELAHFLNKQAALKLLAPHRYHTIWAKLEGSSEQLLDDTAFFDHFHLIYASHLIFSSYLFLQRVVKSCPWLIKHSWLGKGIKYVGQACRQELTTGYIADVSIRWIDCDWGYGLFTRTPLRKGALIGGYTGEVGAFNPFRSLDTAYVMQYPRLPWSWHHFLVDASHYGNQLRFVNHSDNPNLVPVAAFDRGLLHILFLTNRSVGPDEQLTFDYGKHYWRRRSYLGP